MNYAIQCTNAKTGKIGCFFFDQKHWQKTGEFVATSGVYPTLSEFFAATSPDERRSIYLERTSHAIM
jgi:hypothetical protein